MTTNLIQSLDSPNQKAVMDIPSNTKLHKVDKTLSPGQTSCMIVDVDESSNSRSRLA